MTAQPTKVPKPKCDGCGAFHWYLTTAGDRRLCEECLDAYVAQRTEEDATLPESKPEYPTPWRYSDGNYCILRDVDDEGDQVAMVFDKRWPPEPELIVLILAVMNGWHS